MRCLTFSLALLAALAVAAPSPTCAQTPPTDRDLQIYVGLHAPGAAGGAAEIEKLIKEGENPNVQDSNSRTPLLVAAYRKHYEAARALIRLGADPKKRDLQRFDILAIAATNNDMELLKIGLE